MLTNYIVRGIVGPAGQIVAGRRRFAGQTVSLSPEDAKSELERGVIEKIGGQPEVQGGSDDESPRRQGGKPLGEMTKDELLAEAKARGVDVNPADRKAEILQALQAGE